jgi:hypothetical protein
MYRAKFYLTISIFFPINTLFIIKRIKSSNGVQILYPWGTTFFEVQTAQMGYCTPKWGTVGSPGEKRNEKEREFFM